MKDGEKTKEGIGKLPIPDKDGAQGYCKLEKELKNLKDDLLTWTDSLDELSVIERAFKTYEKNSPDGKAILDVGTDCVKPLYIALKFKPAKVIGINEDLYIYSFASDLKQKSKFFTNRAASIDYGNADNDNYLELMWIQYHVEPSGIWV